MQKSFIQHTFFLLLLSLFLGTSIRAENTDLYSIHLDKEFYVSGEYVWFKLYLPSTYQAHDVMFRVSLFSPETRFHQQCFIPTLGDSELNGFFKIPNHWATDTYQLAFSGAHKQTQENILLAYAYIPIIHPEKIEGQLAYPQKFLEEIPFSQLKKDNMHIEFAPYPPGVMEKSQVKVSVKGHLGQSTSVSVSIREWEDSRQAILPFSTTHTSSSSISPEELSNKAFAYYQLHSSTKTIAEGQDICFFHAQSQSFGYTRTDSNGHISVNMPAVEGSSTLQFIHPEGFLLNATLVEPSMQSVPSSLFNLPSDFIKTHITHKLLRANIHNLYGKEETDLYFPTQLASSASILKPNRRVYMDDYPIFPTLPIFLKEVPTTLKYRKQKGGTYAFNMFNPGFRKRDFYPGTPLFVVDGRLTKNTAFIEQLSPRDIAYMDMYFEEGTLQNSFGSIGKGGVVFIKTRLEQLTNFPEEESNIFPIQGIASTPQFPIAIKEPNPEVPTFRSTLYWNPDLETNSAGECTFSFVQSHDRGRFVIEVLAQTKGGNILKQHFFYDVK